MMFGSISLSGCVNRSPWTLRRFDHVVVCSKKKPPNDGYPGRGRRPRKKYSKDVEDDVDISPLYEGNAVTEIPRGFVVDCNKHINNCIKRRDLKEAQEVFDLMIKNKLYPDVVTYNTLMKGYSGAGDNQMVYKLFRDMEKNGLRPTEITFSTIICACANSGDLRRALILFDKMKNRYWLEPDAHIYSAMFNVCASAKGLEEAREIFEEMVSSGTRYDTITLTAMIHVYAECCNESNGREHFRECRYLLEDMDLKGVKADMITFNTLLNLCAKGSLTVEAMALLDEMKCKNVHPSAVSYCTVLDGISKNEELSDEEVLNLSKEIVHRMRHENISFNAHTYSVLINVALRLQDLSRAVDLFSEMKRVGVKPTAATYGVMIKCYEKLGDPSTGDVYLKPCLDLLEECEQSGILMGLGGYISLLSACANVANVETALKIWTKMNRAKTKLDVVPFNAMIGVFLSADATTKAFHLLDEMKTFRVVPNEVTYTTFLTHFRKKKDKSGAQRIYDKMKSLGVKPDKDTLRMLKSLRVK